MSASPPDSLPFKFTLAGAKPFTVRSAVPPKWSILVNGTPMNRTITTDTDKGDPDEPRKYEPSVPVPVPTPDPTPAGPSAAANLRSLVDKTTTRIQELVAKFDPIRAVVTDPAAFRAYDETEVQAESAMIQAVYDLLDTQLASTNSLADVTRMKQEADDLLVAANAMDRRLQNFLQQTDALQALILAPNVLSSAQDIQKTAQMAGIDTAALINSTQKLAKGIADCRTAAPNWTISEELREKIKDARAKLGLKLMRIPGFQEMARDLERRMTPKPLPVLSDVSKFRVPIPAATDAAAQAQIARLLDGLSSLAVLRNPYLRIAWQSYRTHAKDRAILEQIKTREIAAFGRPIAEKLNEIRALY